MRTNAPGILRIVRPPVAAAATRLATVDDGTCRRLQSGQLQGTGTRRNGTDGQRLVQQRQRSHLPLPLADIRNARREDHRQRDVIDAVDVRLLDRLSGSTRRALAQVTADR